VETPGTAPGSDPLMTSAFMSIVPEGTKTNIGVRAANLKRENGGRRQNIAKSFSAGVVNI